MSTIGASSSEEHATQSKPDHIVYTSKQEIHKTRVQGKGINLVFSWISIYIYIALSLNLYVAYFALFCHVLWLFDIVHLAYSMLMLTEINQNNHIIQKFPWMRI